MQIIKTVGDINEKIKDNYNKEYKELIKKIEDNENLFFEILKEKRAITFFLGAGISMAYGLKSWEKLADTLLKECLLLEEKEIRMTPHELNIALEKYNAKEKITIASNILGEKKYIEILKKETKFEKEKEHIKENTKNNKDVHVLEILSKINKSKNSKDIRFITTNIDRLLEEYLYENREDKNIFYDFKNKEEGYKDRNEKICKIHGCVGEEKSIVFTPKEYFDLYNKDSIRDFLKKERNKAEIIFIGKELEPEIMQLFHTTDSKTKNIFLLKSYGGIGNHNFLPSLKLDMNYYDHYSVKIIPFNEYSTLPIFLEEIKDILDLTSKETRDNISNRIFVKAMFRSSELLEDISERIKIDEINYENNKILNSNIGDILKNSKTFTRNEFIKYFLSTNRNEFIKNFFEEYIMTEDIELPNIFVVLEKLSSKEITNEVINKTMRFIEKEDLHRKYSNYKKVIIKLLLTKVENKKVRDKIYEELFAIKKDNESDTYELKLGIDFNFYPLEEFICYDRIDEDFLKIKKQITLEILKIEDIFFHEIISGDEEKESYHYSLNHKVVENFLNIVIKILSLKNLDEIGNFFVESDKKLPLLIYLIANSNLLVKKLTPNEIFQLFLKYDSTIYNILKKNNLEKLIERKSEKELEKEGLSLYEKFCYFSLIGDKKNENNYKNKYKKENGVNPQPPNLSIFDIDKLKFNEIIESYKNESKVERRLAEIKKVISGRIGSFIKKRILILYEIDKAFFYENFDKFPIQFKEGLCDTEIDRKELEEILEKILEKNEEIYRNLLRKVLTSLLKMYKEDYKNNENKIKRILELTKEKSFLYKDDKNIKLGGKAIRLEDYIVEILFFKLKNEIKNKNYNQIECVIEEFLFYKNKIKNTTNFYLGQNLPLMYYILEKKYIEKSLFSKIVTQEKEFYNGFYYNSRLSSKLYFELKKQNNFFVNGINDKNLEIELRENLFKWIIVFYKNDKTFENEIKLIEKDKDFIVIVFNILKSKELRKKLKYREILWKIVKEKNIDNVVDTLNNSINNFIILKNLLDKEIEIDEYVYFFEVMFKTENSVEYILEKEYNEFYNLLKNKDKKLIVLFINYLLREKKYRNILKELIKKMTKNDKFEILENESILDKIKIEELRITKEVLEEYFICRN